MIRWIAMCVAVFSIWACQPGSSGGSGDCRMADNACAGGFICAEIGADVFQCRQPCRDGACPAGDRCDDFTGACVPGDAPNADGSGLDTGPISDAGDLGPESDSGLDASPTLDADPTMDATPTLDAVPTIDAVPMDALPSIDAVPIDAAPTIDALPLDASLGRFGEPCGSPDDCASGLCLEDGDRTYCSQPCGDRCPPLGDDFNEVICNDIGICVPRGDVPLGGPCDERSDCLSGRCAFAEEGPFCTDLCDRDNDCANPRTSLVCDGDACIRRPDAELRVGNYLVGVDITDEGLGPGVLPLHIERRANDTRLMGAHAWCGIRPCGPEDPQYLQPLDERTNDISLEIAGDRISFETFGGVGLAPEGDPIDGLGWSLDRFSFEGTISPNADICGVADVRLRRGDDAFDWQGPFSARFYHEGELPIGQPLLFACEPPI